MNAQLKPPPSRLTQIVAYSVLAVAIIVVVAFLIPFIAALWRWGFTV